MLRREAYATSGTRPVVRFFGGWEDSIEESICEADDLVERAYAGGVPMGGSLESSGDPSAAPRFVVAAERDAQRGAAPLDRIEIVKGRPEGEGGSERVEIVAATRHASTVDPSTCERSGRGSDTLCAVWTDEDFDPSEGAYYYARLIEDSSCRWSQWACVDAGVDCADPSSVGPGFEACCSEEAVRTIQERAWTSPIWYTPRSPGAGSGRDARRP